MNKTSKTILWIVVIAVVVVIIALLNGDNKNVTQESKTFKIGVILPLSGPAANFGETSKRTVDLALSKIKESGNSNIEVVYGDDQLDTKQTTSVAQKLIDIDHVNAIIAWSSPTSVVASSVAENKEIPMIGLGNSPEINTNKKWVLRYMLGPASQAKAIEDLLLKGKYKKIAIIWNQSDGPKSVHDALVKDISIQGYELVADESVTKTENDFKTSIAKIRSAKPDVVIAYISPQVGVFAKQAKDLNLGIPLVSGPTFEIVEQIKVAQGGLDNQLFVGADNADFIQKYFEKYNSYPTIANDYLYDALVQFAKASSDQNSKQQIIDFLRQDFEGVTGKYTYNGDGSFDVTQVVKKWDGQKFIRVR